MKEASHSIGWLASLTASNTQREHTESYVTSYTYEVFELSRRITQDEIEECRKEIADSVWGDFMKNIIYLLTVINIAFQVVYSTFGRYTTDDIYYIFVIFRPEYLLLSGLISAVLIAALVIVCIFRYFTNRDNFKIADIIVVLLNIEYLYYYMQLIAVQ